MRWGSPPHWEATVCRRQPFPLWGSGRAHLGATLLRRREGPIPCPPRGLGGTDSGKPRMLPLSLKEELPAADSDRHVGVTWHQPTGAGRHFGSRPYCLAWTLLGLTWASAALTYSEQPGRHGGRLRPGESCSRGCTGCGGGGERRREDREEGEEKGPLLPLRQDAARVLAASGVGQGTGLLARPTVTVGTGFSREKKTRDTPE